MVPFEDLTNSERVIQHRSKNIQLTTVGENHPYLTFKAMQRIRDEQIHVYGEVSDAQPLWWRWLAEREDVCICWNDVTIFLIVILLTLSTP